MQHLTLARLDLNIWCIQRILQSNANHHRLITISRGDSIYEMSLKRVVPQADRYRPPFRLNVSFAVNTERERYGSGGAGSWTPTCGFCAGWWYSKKALISDWNHCYGFLVVCVWSRDWSPLGPRCCGIKSWPLRSVWDRAIDRRADTVTSPVEAVIFQYHFPLSQPVPAEIDGAASLRSWDGFV